MANLTWPIERNPMHTRGDMAKALHQIVEPLQPFYSKGSARIELGSTGTSYTKAVAGLEGFSRVLWGMAPLLAGGEDSALWSTCLQGIKNGTDPTHEEYWGEITDYDQRAVEMAAFGFTLALIPEKIWQPLSAREKENLYTWLNQINHREVYDCNWLFFPVMVNLGLKRAGMPYDRHIIEQNLERIDHFYTEKGWYTDGPDAHCDYYGPFAIHFYSLLYAKWMGDEDPVRAERYKSRAESFAVEFIHWFAKDGSALPYGRSLTYRFAQCAFWGALAYAEVGPYQPGVLKGLVLRHLRWWFSQPIFDANGLLSIGYRYPNLIMAENYNAPGSPYWALKAFLPLALTADHPFWLAEELPLPALREKVMQATPRFLVCREEETDHVVAFSGGYPHTTEHPHTAAKYEKFAYSNRFGFSVPKAEWGLAQSACDSMLAVSERDNLYRVKRVTVESKVTDQWIYTHWKPWPDVDIKTWLIAGLPWHIRVHRIVTGRSLDCADGGFALGLEREEEKNQTLDVRMNKEEVLAKLPWGATGIRSLYGNGHAELVYPNANTNVLDARTVLPVVKATLEPGAYWFVNAVYGEPGGSGDNWNDAPKVDVTHAGIAIGDGTDKIIIHEAMFD
ncbi:MAG TPA: DUF2264 domain-containing protein [Candidatus Bathyarchaeia archaeon]|nr:DUF2264 domain-containing protein [Candidatus Bathyarchaeia archaeon]